MTKYTIVAGQSVGDHVALTISSTSDFSNLIVDSGPGQTDQERSLEAENARLRTELTHAREMNAVAMLDVAAARRALAMEIERHNRFVATLQYTIHAMSEALTAAAEQARNPPAPVKPIVYADWTPPAGLPRGIR